MKNGFTLLPVAAALLIAGQATAESGDGVIVEKTEQRQVEVEQRIHDAEQRMAEAARQIAELSANRLPQLAGSDQRFEFIMDDKPRLGVTIGGDGDDPVKGPSVLGVTPGSAAEEAGLRTGDIITAINGESLAADSPKQASNRLLDFMQGVEAGDTLEIEYERDGKSGTLEVEPRAIESRVFAFGGDGRGFRLPPAPGMAPSPLAPRELMFYWNSDGWGDMELVELNEGLGKYFGTDEGLLVVNAPGSSGLQLEDGDVIQKIDGRQPTSVRHALRILGSYQAGETLTLDIMRDKKRHTLKVEIPDDLSSGLGRTRVAPPAVSPSRAPSPPKAAMPVERT